jgi:hypothetical protein
VIRVSLEFIARARSIACSSARLDDGEPSTATRTFRNTLSRSYRIARRRAGAA